MNHSQTIQIHPQKCYDCGRQLAEGEEAIASMDLPLAFCVPCRQEAQKKNPRLCKAIVRGESA